MLMWGARGHPISTPDICRWCNPAEQAVRYWHLADISKQRPNVRFRGQSGHAFLHCICLLLTQSGHDRLGVCLRSIQKADRFTFRDSNSLSFCMHWS